MSDREEMDITCPKCGAQQKTTVWKKLDVASDPGIKEALFGWQINIFCCSACDLRAQLPVGLLYRDAAKGFSVQFYPMDGLGSDEFYQGFRKDGEPLDTGCDAGEPKPHMVFDMAEMMRYIVFREIVSEKGQ